MNYTILLLIVSIISLLPVFFIKKYLNSKIKSNLYFAGFFYIVLLISYIKIFSHYDLTTAYTAIQILQVLIIALVGIFVFKEILNFNKIIGIISGVISIYFLTKF
jgi:drug/metabolite transporter (DMT)-like permease